MNKRGILAFVLASLCTAAAFASCSDSKETKQESSSSAAEKMTENPNVKIGDNEIDIIAEPDKSAEKEEKESEESAPEFDNAVEAEAGEAFLALNCDDWWVQYWGEKTDPLCYDAGVEAIDGNGQYTVSLTMDTDGFRSALESNNGGNPVNGSVGLAAVIIKNGEAVCPDAVISVNSISVNGKNIELSKKSYTNTESGDIRSNIYNEWVSDDGLPSDARAADGALFENDAPSKVNDGKYSAKLADKSAFDGWTEISVTFTVSGLDHDKQ